MYCQLEPLKSMFMVTGPQRTLIFVAPIDNTSLVCDPSWVSNALEQAERLISHTRAKKVLHNFAWNLLYNKVLHTFAWNPLYCNTNIQRRYTSINVPFSGSQISLK